MAEITFNVQARFDEVVKARQELARLREELLKIKRDTPKDVVESLEKAYQAQSETVKKLTENLSLYRFAIEKYGGKLSFLNNLVQVFNDKAQSTKTKIGEVSSEVDKMQSKLSSGNLDAEAGASLSHAISDKIFSLKELEKLYNDLVSAAQKANVELQGTISEAETSTRRKGILSDIVESTKATNDEATAHTKVVEQVNAEATALKNVSQSLQDGQPFKSYEDQIAAIKQRISELQEKIVDTKESIQFAKNDVADLTAQKEANAKKYGEKTNGSIDEAITGSKQEVDEQTRALQSYQIELQRAKLQLANLNEEQKAQAEVTKAESNEFTAITAKIEEWKSSLYNIDGLNQKFESQKLAITGVKDSINELNQSSQSNSAWAEQLKQEIETMSASLRLSSSEMDSSSYGKVLDELKEKASQYAESLNYASGQSNAAIELQKEAIAGLEDQLATLQEQLQAAQATNNSAAVQAISEQINVLSNELNAAKNNLVGLQQQSENAKNAMRGLADVQSSLSMTEKGGSFFGNIIDEAQLIKQKVSDAFSSLHETISSKFEAIKSKASEVGSSISGSLSNLSDKIGLDRLGNAFSSVGERIGAAKDKMLDFATGGGKFQSSIGNLKTALNGLPLPLGNVIGSIGAMTKALWAMCATPIGAALAAVAVGLQAVYAWFTKSAEGQKAFTKISAYMGSLMASLTDIVVMLGSYLYHCFADAKGPLRDFGLSFKNTFVSAVKTGYTLLKGLGTTLKGIFQLDWDTFTDGLSQVGDGLIKAGKTAIMAVQTQIKGIVGSVKTVYDMFTNDKLGSGIGKALSDLFPKAKQAAKIAEQDLQANIALGKAKEEQDKLEKTIAEKREKIYNLTGKAKQEAIAETKALLKQKYDSQIKAQTELYELQKKRNALHTSSLADLKRERELHIEVLSTQAQQAASTRMLTRMEASNQRSMDKAAKNAEKKAAAEAKKNATKQNNIVSAEGKLAEAIYKNEYERSKAMQSIEEKVTDARIKAMQDGEEKVIAERKRALEKEIEQIETEKNAAIKAEINRQKSEYDTKAAIVKAQGGKPQQWDDKMLDQEPIKKIEKQYTIIEESAVTESNRKTQKEQAQAMLDYLKAYGTFQEKKYAIAKEYDEKINLETDTYKKASLEKEKSKAISDVDTSALQSQIDWQSVFGSMIGSLQEQLKETFQGLKEYTKTDDFKKKDATEQKVIYEAIDKMRGALTGDHEGTLNLSKLKKQSEDLGNAFKEMQAAGLREKIAFDNLQVAQDSYEKALKTGDKAQIKGASQTLDSAKAIYDGAKKTSEEMVKTVKAKGVEYKESSQGTLDGLNEVASGLKEFSGGSLSGLMSGLTNTVLGLSKLDLGKTLNKSVSKLADKLQSGGNIGKIISAILSILDILKDGIGSLVANVIDAILNAVNGILKNILSGKFVEQIGGSLLEGVGNILNTVTFGGLSSWLGDGSSDKNLEKDLSRLSESNNNLKTSIDALADKMDEASSMQDITTSYEKQKEAIQDQIKNTQESMYRSGAAYTSGHWYKAYTDGKHSSNKKINDAMSSEDWDKVSKAAGVSVRSASDFWNLTSEQMANVAAYAATQYDKIKQYGDDGYKNASQYMNTYIEYYKQLEQLENSYREKLTSISFDSVESDFKSMLENMDSDSTDFADSFQKKMASAIINSLMVDKYKQRLQDWYKSFSSTFENKNLTKEELYKAQDKLKQEYMAISKDALDERDSLKDALGWKDNFSQSASSGSFESMSQDTGEELNGRFTAVQIATEGTYEEAKLINTKLDAIAARDGGIEGSLLTASVNTIMGDVGNIWTAVDEGRTILAQSLMYLQSIDERQDRWSKPMLRAFERIDRIADKVDRL